MQEILTEIQKANPDTQRLDELNAEMARFLLRNCKGERLRLGLEVCRWVAEYAAIEDDD